MKNFFKKNDLFKIGFISILILCLLTWFIPAGQFTGATLTDLGINAVSLYDFPMTYFYTIYYFLIEVFFLFVVGGLYGVLSKSKAYGTLVVRIAKKVKKNINVFLVVVSLLLAVFTSMNTQILVGFLFIPFIIQILSLLEVSKLKTFCATFGSMFVGIIGGTLGTSAFENMNTTLGLTATDGILWKLAFFAVAYGLLGMFMFMKRSKKEEKIAAEDLYELELPRKNLNVKPLAIVLGFLAILTVVGYLPWASSFGVTVFDELQDTVSIFAIGGYKPFYFIFGSLDALGEWDLFTMAFILLLASIVLGKMSYMTLDEIIDGFKDGLKRISKVVFIFILACSAFTVMYWSPIVPTIVNKLIPADASFGLFPLFIVGLISGVLHVNHQFAAYTLGGYFASLFAGHEIATMLILNTTYGLTQLIAPTSMLLFAGLAYMDISYKEYFKMMWKYIVAITCFVLLLLIILVYI